MLIGLGYDLHQLAEGRPLILGGVSIPHEKGLLGHSDGDALCHAVIDALLGALALGDIGSHFPDTDPAYKNANSLDLLLAVMRLVKGAGHKVVNVDSVVIAQRPRLRPYIDTMRRRLAECLEIPIERVSVKAKTNENVGPEGREEAISTQAVVLLEKQ
ncbi:MAG: 2-C-methyl-D-erythritol 2,4-cyclodiphosphate synthase [Candidatus Hydrogenedentes bacterium]|nr:2-C-methyl-D-erythritol 2,4-cyclodiphosphate synthase [Candidatus Hydrogenedentota bacterium]MBI3119316.1 2-C-methyl-D-erythritol 2,4-cyclodiphosphate synthase [Candidatus Hydrogenedentota bacterium]